LEKANALESPAYVAAFLGYAYGASGDRVKANAMIDEVGHKSPSGYVPQFNLAIIYLGMGDRARALDSLEKAYADHSQWLNSLKMERIFDPLRSEPRFIALLKKMNLEK
jgi:adenylate cyclase